MDHGTHENENRFMFSYFASLIGSNVFRIGEVVFLTVGHTDEDIGLHFPLQLNILKIMIYNIKWPAGWITSLLQECRLTLI